MFAELILIMLLTTALTFIAAYFGVSSASDPKTLDPITVAIRINDGIRVMATVLGLMCVALGLEADRLGLGAVPGIGPRQVSLIIAGTAVLALACVIRTKRPAKEHRKSGVD